MDWTHVGIRHDLVEQVWDDRDEHQKYNVEKRYQTRLDREDGHIARVDYPAGDQDQED